MSNPYVGSTLTNFLSDQGILAECQAEAIKRIISWHLAEYLKKNKITKSEFARKLGTSRIALDRLLDETNTSVTLHSLAKVAEIMDKRLEISLT